MEHEHMIIRICNSTADINVFSLPLLCAPFNLKCALTAIESQPTMILAKLSGLQKIFAQLQAGPVSAYKKKTSLCQGVCSQAERAQTDSHETKTWSPVWWHTERRHHYTQVVDRHQTSGVTIWVQTRGKAHLRCNKLEESGVNSMRKNRSVWRKSVISMYETEQVN